VAKILKWAKEHEVKPEDVVQTATAFTAATVAHSLEKLNLKGRWELIVSGGGAYNPVLMIHLAAMAEKFLVRRSDDLGLPADAKEAMAFAVLAYEAWAGRPNSLPSATGAVCPMVLGKIAYG
jgi:anhydro-N-acetylmuramic acid kinase